MNPKIATRRVSLLLLLFTLCAVTALAQTTSFTYQGRLTDGGIPANGTYDLQFALWDSNSGGTQIATQTVPTVAVSAGIFSVTLDFGASAFPGANRFLEIGARLSGSGNPFTTLSPRQQITSTPYALRSLNASSADAVTVSGVPGGSGNYIQNATTPQTNSNFNISGNGTAGGTLSSNIVNATAQYNIGGNRLVSTAGANNLFVGLGSGQANTSGQRNSFFGASAGAANNSSFNSFFGNLAGAANTDGQQNSFFGASAGAANKEGGANSFFGGGAGFNNTQGSNNSFFGLNAGFNNTTGEGNTAVGRNAGFSNTTGQNNTFIGYNAQGAPAATNANATAIGAFAQVDQSNALVLGSVAGFNGATASVNVGIGTTTPTAKLDIRENQAMIRFSGVDCGPNFGAITFGNVALGCANYSLLGEGVNTFINRPAGGVITFRENNIDQMRILSGGNVGIGTTTPKHRLALVGGPGWTSANWTGALEIGNGSAIGWQGNAAGWHFGIGQTNGGLYFFRTSSELGSTLSPVTYDMVLTDGGNVGIGTTAPDWKLSVNGDASKSLGGGSWQLFSDERLKNIKGRFNSGLSAVMQLQPIRYEYKRDNALGLKSEIEQVGFGAQALQKVIPEAVTKNANGYLMVNNDPILWTMLNAIKEQQSQIETLRTANVALNARLRTVEKVLRKRVGPLRRRR